MGIFNFFKRNVDSQFKPEKSKVETKQIIEYHENGKLKIQGTVDAEGEFHGNYKEWYENGKISKDENYNHGTLQGSTKYYFENGKLFQEVYFNNGVSDGKKYEYYDNGVLSLLNNHREGIEHGLQEQYYPNGNLEYRATFFNGKLEGVRIFVDENGQVLEEMIFKEGYDITNELMAVMLDNDCYHMIKAGLVTDSVQEFKPGELLQNIYDYYKINNLDVEPSEQTRMFYELKNLFLNFDKKIAEIEEDDLPYWYNIIKERATSTLSQSIEELIWGHADEYSSRLIGEDVYNNGRKFNQEEKVAFIKMRIEAFGKVFNYLSDLESEINKLIERYKISIIPIKEKLDSELKHAKASLYGAIKYAKSIGILNSNIYEWYSDFEDDNDLINGQNPFENLIKKYNLNNLKKK